MSTAHRPFQPSLLLFQHTDDPRPCLFGKADLLQGAMIFLFHGRPSSSSRSLSFFLARWRRVVTAVWLIPSRDAASRVEKPS